MGFKSWIRRSAQRVLGVDRYLVGFHQYLHLSYRFPGSSSIPYYRTKFADLRWMDDYLKPGMTVVDVGANIGFYSRVFAQAVGTDGKVLAIEPVQINRKVLLRSIPDTLAPRLIVVSSIVSDKAGSLRMELTSSEGAFLHGTCHVADESTSTVATSREEVDSETLDGIVRQHGLKVDLVKIDVEGHELNVLKGARETLLADHPVIACEIHEEKIDLVVPYLVELGYALHWISESGALVAIDRRDPAWRWKLDYICLPRGAELPSRS